MEAALQAAVRDALLTPVWLGAALQGAGARALLDGLVTFMPDPKAKGALRAVDKDGAETELTPDPEGALAWTLHILQHPLDMPRAKSRAERLQAELAEQLTPDRIDAVQKRVQDKPFEQLVTEALQAEAKA